MDRLDEYRDEIEDKVREFVEDVTDAEIEDAVSKLRNFEGKPCGVLGLNRVSLNEDNFVLAQQLQSLIEYERGSRLTDYIFPHMDDHIFRPLWGVEEIKSNRHMELDYFWADELYFKSLEIHLAHEDMNLGENVHPEVGVGPNGRPRGGNPASSILKADLAQAILLDRGANGEVFDHEGNIIGELGSAGPHRRPPETRSDLFPNAEETSLDYVNSETQTITRDITLIFDSKFYEQLRQEHKALAKSGPTGPKRIFGGLYEMKDIEEFIDFLSEQPYGGSFIPYPAESEEWNDAFELWAVPVEDAPPDNCLEGWAEEMYWSSEPKATSR